MSDFPHVLEPLLDSEQAAAHVKVHKKTLQRYARNGLVVGLRVGKLWRFSASDLDEWSQGPEPTPIYFSSRPRYGQATTDSKRHTNSQVVSLVFGVPTQTIEGSVAIQ